MDRVAVGLVALVAISGCLGLGPTTPTPGTPAPPADADLAVSYSVTVTAVIDGDTVEVRYRNGTTETVRLLGVDTPETRGENDPAEFEGVPETAAGRSCLREAGHGATRAMTRRLLGETVTLGVDAESDRRGYYGRLLAYVYQDDTNVNYWLLAQGHARVYDSQFTERASFEAAERRARTDSAGLWACATGNPPTATPAGTPTPTATAVTDGGVALRIVEIRADAAGDDRENLNGEAVVFANRGDERLAVGGWTVTDEASHTYTFPAGTTVDPGARVTLRTGTGTDTASTLYWNQGAPVWNNGGDTVTVRSGNGLVVARRSY